MLRSNKLVNDGLDVVFVCLHVTLSHYRHHADLANSKEDITCLSRLFCKMCLRLCQFSQSSFMQYTRLCEFSLPISLVMIAGICVRFVSSSSSSSSNRKNEPLSIVQGSLTLSQWSSSGNPVAIQCAWNLDPSVHLNATEEMPVCFQWSSSGFPVVFQCVPIM